MREPDVGCSFSSSSVPCVDSQEKFIPQRLLFNGIFVDVGNVTNGDAPSVDWRELYHYLSTQLLKMNEAELFDVNMCCYYARNDAEQDVALQLQRITGAETVASSLSKNDSDMKLMSRIQVFADRRQESVRMGYSRPPFGHVVLVTGDSDFSDIVGFMGERGFIPLVVSFSTRISRALKQRVYGYHGTFVNLDNFAVGPLPCSDSPVVRSRLSSPKEPDSPSASVPRFSDVSRFSIPLTEHRPYSQTHRPAPCIESIPEEKLSSTTTWEPPQPDISASADFTPPPGGAGSVPDFRTREAVQKFVQNQKVVPLQLPNDHPLQDLDYTLMCAITGIWCHGQTPTFNRTKIKMAERMSVDQEEVANHLRHLIETEMLVQRELYFEQDGEIRTSLALVPTQWGIAAAKLQDNNISKPALTAGLVGSVFSK